jgi:hypothetical protein
MGIPRARGFIEQAGQAGIRRIVFTGGEPLLHPRDIRILIRHAAGEGIESALITNGAWASSRIRTKEYLSDLKQSGLQSVTLSTDRYHLLEVAVERLEMVLDVAGDLGIRTVVKIARLAHDPVAEGLSRSLGSDSTRVCVQEIAPLGRGDSLRRAVRLRSASAFSGPGCRTPSVLLPDGSLLACCNLPARDMRPTDYPFVLGNAEELPLQLLLQRRFRDSVLTLLRRFGPGTLLDLLERREPGFSRQHPALYHSRCDFCFHVFCRMPDKGFLYAALGQQSGEHEPP